MKNIYINFYLFSFLSLLACAKEKPTNEIPEWSQGTIWYQIFPERYNNGDDNNNPNVQDIKAPEGWKISEWTMDWYSRSDWESNSSPDFYSTVRDRRYGGDLQGVINKLDYIKDLGVNVIYFNPIFDAPSEHKYDAAFYHHIDRFFGPDPEGDLKLIKQENFNNPSTWKWTSADLLFLKLVQEAHNRNLRIVIDGVFNHTGQEFWAFADVRKKQENSEFRDWYDIISWDDPTTPDTDEFDFRAWSGLKGLPEFKEIDGNIVYPVRQHLFHITKRWMDPNNDGKTEDGVDGWRLDVAFDIGHNFWKEWTDSVRSINPEALIIAEIWEQEQAKEYISDDEFDAVMNYPFLFAVYKFFIQESISAQEFDSSLTTIRAPYFKEVNLAMMNLVGSHDTERLGSMIANPKHNLKEGTKLDDNPDNDYNISAPSEERLDIQKLVALFQYTYIGSPMIYYGDEAGMWGADDPDNRKPMIWPEYDYEPEKNHPYGREVSASEVKFNDDLFNWYKFLGSTRNLNEVLRMGDYKTLYANDKAFIFARHYRDKVAVVGINLDNSEIKVSLKTNFSNQKLTSLTDLLTMNRFQVIQDNLDITIKNKSAVILLNWHIK